MKKIIRLHCFVILVQCFFCYPFDGINKRSATIIEKKNAVKSEKNVIDIHTQVNTKGDSSATEDNNHQLKKDRHSNEKIEEDTKKEKNLVSDARLIYCIDRVCEVITDIIILKENFNCKEKNLRIKFYWPSDHSFKNMFLTPNCGVIINNQQLGEHCPVIRR